MSFFRGSTPTIEFHFPFDCSLLAEVWIAGTQEGFLLLDKTLKDCSAEGNILRLKLTQEETLALQDDFYLKLQLRYRTLDGTADATEPVEVLPGELLKEGVI